jgi:hypothetical protein
MGGLECVNVTINQIIKILIFIYNVIKQKYWKSVEELNGKVYCWGA